jgi:hypothetical protein
VPYICTVSRCIWYLYRIAWRCKRTAPIVTAPIVTAPIVTAPIVTAHSCCQTYPRKTDYPSDPWLRRCHLQNSPQHSTQQIGCSLSQCHQFCHQSPIYYPPLWPVCSRRLALTTYSSPNSLAPGHL